MTKDEFILYQALMIYDYYTWKTNALASLAKHNVLSKAFVKDILNFPCGFDPEKLLQQACFNLKIGTLKTSMKSLRELAREYLHDIEDKNMPNAKNFNDMINSIAPTFDAL
jgi:hypothetical protein